MKGKRLFDVIFAIAGLVLFSPIMIAIGGLLWIVQGRPIIFRQQRTGKGGVPFTIYKFRSCQRRTTPNCRDPQSGEITPPGRILRRTGLDELPQLVNILLGTMSVVGPRPDMVHVQNQYPTEALAVKPGWLSLWIVVRKTRDATEDLPLKVAADLWYAQNQSWRVDIQILLRAPWAICRGRGMH